MGTKLDWLDIERHVDHIHEGLLERFGKVIDGDYELIYDEYVCPFFTTWDNFSCNTNGDIIYAPVVFSWFAKRQGMKPTYPIRIMRFAIEEWNKLEK